MTRASIRPGLAHALLALALQAAVGVPAVIAIAFGGGPALAGLAWPFGMVGGACFAVGFYVGRERRQSEEWWGSNRIPPWQWKPRALRDIGWPALAVGGVVLGVVWAG